MEMLKEKFSKVSWETVIMVLVIMLVILPMALSIARKGV